MFDHRLRKTWILLWLAVATTAPARAEGPRAGFKLKAEYTEKSPDQTMWVEQYAKAQEDESLLYQFWTFDRDHRHPFLLNPGENDQLAGYAAGFRFSPDSQWLVRMQKLGAGYQTLFLYTGTGINSRLRPPNPLAIWPGIISSRRRHQRACIGTRRIGMRWITPSWDWSRAWRKITLGWESTGPTVATS